MKTREEKNLRQKLYRAKKKAEGRCVECGARPPEIGRVRCLKCLDRLNDINRNRKKRHQQAGKCRCGNDKEPEYYACAICREKSKKASKRNKQLREENNKCKRCGRPLIQIEGREKYKYCIICCDQKEQFMWN